MECICSWKKQNDDLMWKGQGFNTKLYRQLQISVQTDKYITYRIQVQCVLVGNRGSITGIECFSWRKEYIFGWGVKKQEITEERTEASHLCFFHLIFLLSLCTVGYNLQLEKVICMTSCWERMVYLRWVSVLQVADMSCPINGAPISWGMKVL